MPRTYSPPTIDATRYPQLRQMLSLMQRIEGRRYIDHKRIAEDMGLSERTVRRYLIVLEDCGWKIPRWRYDE